MDLLEKVVATSKQQKEEAEQQIKQLLLSLEESRELQAATKQEVDKQQI